MLRAVRHRGCRRCGGNLFLERDEYGTYISCIQCGAVYRERLEQAHTVRRSEDAGNGHESKPGRW